MLERDKSKVAANNVFIVNTNTVTKLNYNRKKYFQEKMCSSVNYSKQLWKTLNEILCNKSRNSPKYVECAGQFITRPYDVTKYFNNLL